MDVANIATNAAVVAAIGLILGWLGKGRFESIDRRFDAIDRRFDAIDRRFDAHDQRIERLEERLEGRIDGLQTSTDSLRSDLTRVALAVGVRPQAQNG